MWFSTTGVVGIRRYVCVNGYICEKKTKIGCHVVQMIVTVRKYCIYT